MSVLPRFDEVTLNTPLPGWGLVLALGLLAALAWRSWRRYAPLPPRPRRFLRGLRMAGLVLTGLVLLQPELLRWQLTPRHGTLAVVLDASGSMLVDDEEGGSRWRRAVEAAHVLIRRSSEGTAVRLYLLEDEVRPLPSGVHLDPNTPPRAVARSDLRGALERWLATRSGSASAPAAVLLLSDGADTEGSTPELPTLQGVPVHAIALGGRRPLRDRAVIGVEAPATVPVRDRVRVRVRVRASGSRAERLPIRLWRGEQLLAEAEAELDEHGEGEAELPFLLRTRGHAVLRVEVEPLEGDEVPENDVRHLLVEARREHLRVLHLAGRPSWDVRFLRAFLKRDPGTRLVSFFILRTEGDETNAAPEEMALIPFPTDELFRQHLDRFDVVILQNFDYEPYGIAPYLPGLARHVRRGGGLVMIGGERAFERGGYASTPLAPLLPVRLRADHGAETNGSLWEEPFRPIVAPGADAHPLVNLWSEAAMGWGRLAPVDLLHRVAAVREEAVVLLRHPSLRADDGSPAPVLALSWPDRGRVAALLTDGSWRWGMPSAAKGGDPSSHGRFWDRLLRWAAGDPSLAPCRLRVAQARLAQGEPIEVSLHARDRSFRALQAREMVLAILDDQGGFHGTRRITSDAAGKWNGRLSAPERPGGYRIALQGQDLRCDTWVLVEPGGRERTDPSARHDWLRGLAHATGGAFFEEADDLPAPQQIGRHGAPRRTLERTAPLRSWPVLAILFSLFAFEWRLRRRHGLP